MENNKTKTVETSKEQPKNRWVINHDLCTGCGECVDACTRGLLVISDKKVKMTDEYGCPQCGECVMACTTHAIKLT